MQVKWAVFIFIVLVNIMPFSTQLHAPDTYFYNGQRNDEYSFSFRTADGTERSESGSFEGEGNYVIRGHYSYKDPAGKTQYVSYYADNTGYYPRINKGPGGVSYSAGIPFDVARTLIG